MAESAIAFLRQQDGSRPFFCKASIFDPHNPYQDHPSEMRNRIQAGLAFSLSRLLRVERDDPATGQGRILFSNPANPVQRADGTQRLSRDDGRTWNAGIRYARRPAPYFTGYSDISILPDDGIGVLHERGEPGAGKAYRYDEITFVVVPFAKLLAVPASPAAGAEGTP